MNHRAAVLKRFAPYAKIDGTTAPTLVDEYYEQTTYDSVESAAYSLVQIINFYEYLAIGIRRGMLSTAYALPIFEQRLAAFTQKRRPPLSMR